MGITVLIMNIMNFSLLHQDLLKIVISQQIPCQLSIVLDGESETIETRQKGLQSNSVPMCSFVFLCWHCGEAIERFGHQKSRSYSGELLTARNAVKKKSLVTCTLKGACEVIWVTPPSSKGAKVIALHEKTKQPGTSKMSLEGPIRV